MSGFGENLLKSGQQFGGVEILGLLAGLSVVQFPQSANQGVGLVGSRSLGRFFPRLVFRVPDQGDEGAKCIGLT